MFVCWDSIFLLGEYEPRYKNGLIPGSDCCGYIEKIGNNDRVLTVSALIPWYSLISIGNLKKGERVLIECTGNDSLYVIRISHSFGATKTIVITSQGVDHVVDVIASDYFNKAIHESRPQGHIYSIGFLKNPKVDISIYDQMNL
ncbi:hypothetical protein ACTFIU_003272 [Dictyostelium citrinum]